MTIQEKAIGVFDSGLGGISVLHALKDLMPNEHYIYYGDSAFAPYGEKQRSEITARCRNICDVLIEKGVKAIVIACNTATSACVDELRIAYPFLPIIGMEPAIKLAAQEKKRKHIAVMATPFTLREKKFVELTKRYHLEEELIPIPCPQLVRIVENDELDQAEMILEQLRIYYKDICMESLDSIVLGCTHFVFYKSYIKKIVPSHIRLVDGNAGTARHVKEILEAKQELNPQTTQGNISIYNSTFDAHVIALSKKLLERIL